MQEIPQVVALCRLTLAQKRFKAGALYISCIHTGKALNAIDVRFFVEDQQSLIPTKQGFRVPADRLQSLRSALEAKTIPSDGVEVASTANRRLLIRSCDDEYGPGVDVRYFSDSARYVGWEPRGIRFRPEDFERLRTTLLATDFRKGGVIHGADLFAGKIIRSRSEAPTGAKATRRESTLARDPSINQALLDFIDSQ